MEEKSTETKLQELEAKLEELTNSTAKTISDLTAERDGMKELLEASKVENETLKKDLQDTKKLNFVLANTKSAKPKQSFDDALLAMMGVTKSDGK